MKRIHFYILSVISLFITSCATDDFYIEEKTNSNFHISEAQSHLEKRMSMTTRADMSSFENSGFYYGDFDVDWETSTISEGNYLYNIETQLNSDYKYAYLIDNKAVQVYSQLISIKNKEDNKVKTYIKTLVPALEYAQTHKMNDLRSIQNVGKQDDFSGLIVYSSVEGVPMYVSEIKNGLSVADVSAFDLSHTKWENYEAIKFMLSKYSFVRTDTNITRGDDVNIDIEEIVVTAPKIEKTVKSVTIFDDFDTIREQELEDSFGGGSGGGGSYSGESSWDGNNPTKEITDEDKTKKIFLYNEKWNNITIKSDTADHIDCIINTLNELQELSVFNKIENSIGETIIIYNPDCPYAGLYSKETTIIEIKDLSENGILLEELFHKFQDVNYKNDNKIDNEFEVKCFLAYLNMAEAFILPNVYNAKYYDDLLKWEKDNQDFWNSFKLFLNHQDNEEYFYYAWMELNVVYSTLKTKIITSGRYLKNFYLLF